MARTFSGPLSADDLVYLRQRYTESYVDRQVALYGVADDADSDDEVAEAEEAQRKAQEEADAQSLAEAEERRRQADEEAAAAARAAEEDLIGATGTSGGDGAGDGTFDVLGSTEAEVKTWAESATDEAKAQALATEQAREDRDPRKGVVSLLS